jgi:Tol biopolymer transport system component
MSGRFLRSLSALVATAILGALLYNAIAVDRIPPTFTIKVSSTTAAGEALTLASVEVDFSEDVRTDTAEEAFSITPVVAGTFHWQGRKLIFTPSAKLPLATQFKVREGAGVEDKAGNRQDGSTDLTFTTVGAPKVVSVSPNQNADSVSVDSTIQITFDRQMDTQQVVKGLQIDPMLGYSVTWNGPVLTIQPDRPLAYGTTYTIKIGDPAVDTDGTRLGGYATVFKTVGIGLLVTSTIPAPNVAGVNPRSPIAVVFDAPIDPATVGGSISLTPPVSGSVRVISLPDDRTPSAAATAASDGNVLVFTPDNPLAAHTTYSVSLNSTVKRTDGQVAPARRWSFTTGESATSALNQIAFLSDRGGVANVWLMNPDGSNQRELTTELVPVGGFDITGDGATIAYTSGGVVKKMAVDGSGLQVLTPNGDLEYAPAFTPDGLGLIVGRRDADGADLGYWRYPLATGTDILQLTTDGAPGIGSVTLTGDGLTGALGAPSWASRAAFSSDATRMLVVRGSDATLELVDTTRTSPPIQFQMIGNARPVFDAVEGVFYAIASDDKGETWAYWRIGLDGTATKVTPAAGDLAMTGGDLERLAMIVKSADGSYHLAYAARPGAAPRELTADPTWWELSPSFSPDGSVIVFCRALAANPKSSSGIWVVGVGGDNPINLSLDGAYPRWIP